MHRFIPFIVYVLLCGCGEPEASPMLHLTLKQGDHTKSVLRFRVFRTGRITDSGDRSSDGSGISHSVTIDKITDDGITLTVTLTTDVSDSPRDESKKQVFIPYGRDVTIFNLKDTTLIARLERKMKPSNSVQVRQ